MKGWSARSRGMTRSAIGRRWNQIIDLGAPRQRGSRSVRICHGHALVQPGATPQHDHRRWGVKSARKKMAREPLILNAVDDISNIAQVNGRVILSPRDNDIAIAFGVRNLPVRTEDK